MTYTQLMHTLKPLLRARNIDYSDVADRLGLSVSGVKKIMNADDGSFDRVAQICTLAGLTLMDVLDIAGADTPWVLTDAQQRLFIQQPELWSFLLALRDTDWNLDAVVEQHVWDVETLSGWLAKFENRGIVFHHNGRVTPDAAAGSPWKATSAFGDAVIRPLQDALTAQVRAGIADPEDERPRECGLTQIALTEAHAADLRDELRDLAARYVRTSRLDRHAQTPLVSIGLMSVMGPFSPYPSTPERRAERNA